MTAVRTPIAPEVILSYRQAARERWQAETVRLAGRRERAWIIAHEAAARLKRDYGIQRVVVFGSLAQPGRFHAWSDIDLAAWGLTNANWLKAMSAARELGEREGLEVNLVDVACCAPGLLTAIERDGVTL